MAAYYKKHYHYTAKADVILPQMVTLCRSGLKDRNKNLSQDFFINCVSPMRRQSVGPYKKISLNNVYLYNMAVARPPLDSRAI